MTDDPITTIRARLASSAAKLAKLRAQIGALATETADYETALKVLEQIANTTPATGNAAGHSTATVRSDGDGVTMPDLIIHSLQDGPKPISSVTAKVMELSERPVDPNNVRSTAWRMWKADRIGKTGDNYHLLNHPAATTGPALGDYDIEDLLA